MAHYIMSNILDAAPKPKPSKIAPIKTEAQTGVQNVCVANSKFRALGYQKTSDGVVVFWFYSAKAKSAVSLSSSRLGKPSELVTLLAETEWWLGQFGADKMSGDWMLAISEALSSACYAIGYFDSTIVRGRGVWRDRDRTCIHVGDALYLDGERHPITYPDVDHVYELRPRIHLNGDEPMPASEAHKVLQFYKSLGWSRPHYATLAAGWSVVSLLSGALSWRPHIAILGPAGGGKTYVMATTKALHGGFSINVTSGTTEAALRSSLCDDSIPVYLDESEADGPKGKARMDDILQLMRAASANTDAVIRKAKAGGGGYIEYRPRFCAALAAIRNPITSIADVGRVTVLQIQARPQAEFQRVIKPLAAEITRDSFTKRFRARVFDRAPEILQAIDVFVAAASEKFEDQRLGDQIGTLMGGAWGLGRDRLPTLEEARAELDARDWSDQTQIQAEHSDEEGCLAYVMTTMLPVETPTWRGRVSVHDLALKAGGDQLALGDLDGVVTADSAVRALGNAGLRVQDGRLLIQNSHPELARIMAHSPYPTNWGAVLARLGNATKTPTPVRVLGNQSRGVLVPLKGCAGVASAPPAVEDGSRAL